MMRYILFAFILIICTSESCSNKREPTPKLPISDFSFTIEKEGEVRFVNKSENGIKFLWNFGDNSDDSDIENPIHFYNKNGIYKVSLTISDQANEKRIINKEITISNINPTPPSIVANQDDGYVQYKLDGGKWKTAITNNSINLHSVTLKTPDNKIRFCEIGIYENNLNSILQPNIFILKILNNQKALTVQEFIKYLENNTFDYCNGYSKNCTYFNNSGHIFPIIQSDFIFSVPKDGNVGLKITKVKSIKSDKLSQFFKQNLVTEFYQVEGEFKNNIENKNTKKVSEIEGVFRFFLTF
jgi:PKD repeat protein